MIHWFLTLTAVIVFAPVGVQCIDAVEMYATDRRRCCAFVNVCKKRIDKYWRTRITVKRTRRRKKRGRRRRKRNRMIIIMKTWIKIKKWKTNMKKLRRRNKTMSTKMSKKKHRKDGLNTNLTPIAWTRLNIPSLQLTSRLHVAVGKHWCSWNDRR